MGTLLTFFGALLSRIGLFALFTLAPFEDLAEARKAARDVTEPKGFTMRRFLASLLLPVRWAFRELWPVVLLFLVGFGVLFVSALVASGLAFLLFF